MTHYHSAQHLSTSVREKYNFPHFVSTDFSTGLCDCFSDWPSCLENLFCPCCSLALLAAIANKQRPSKLALMFDASVCFILFPICIPCVSGSTRSHFVVNILGGAVTRTPQLRPGGPINETTTDFVGYCCCCISNMQLQRELILRHIPYGYNIGSNGEDGQPEHREFRGLTNGMSKIV